MDNNMVLTASCCVRRVAAAETGRLVGTRGRAHGTKYRQTRTWLKVPASQRLGQSCSNRTTNINLQPIYSWKGFRCRMWKSLTGPAKAQRWKPKKKSVECLEDNWSKTLEWKVCWKVFIHWVEYNYQVFVFYLKKHKPRWWNTRHFVHTAWSTWCRAYITLK